jgi:hypothetical protein
MIMGNDQARERYFQVMREAVEADEEEMRLLRASSFQPR